jgi:hypothetical protein
MEYTELYLLKVQFVKYLYAISYHDPGESEAFYMRERDGIHHSLQVWSTIDNVSVYLQHS